MELKSFGGKADRLIHLKKLGYKIPDFFVVNAKEYTDKLIAENLDYLEGEYFAVRSSANVEDNSAQSFAGMFTTFLFVKKAEVFEKVKQVIDTYIYDERKPLGSDIAGTLKTKPKLLERKKIVSRVLEKIVNFVDKFFEK